jgi:DNA primase
MNSLLNPRQIHEMVQNERWQTTARDFVRRCEVNLWGNAGSQALRFLHSLGLSDESLRKYRIGFNLTNDFVAMDKWGLPTELNRNGNSKKIWLPHGIVIP